MSTISHRLQGGHPLSSGDCTHHVYNLFANVITLLTSILRQVFINTFMIKLSKNAIILYYISFCCVSGNNNLYVQSTLFLKLKFCCNYGSNVNTFWAILVTFLLNLFRIENHNFSKLVCIISILNLLSNYYSIYFK